MQRAEIVVPLTQPETEWLRGRAVPKVSPTWEHARVQFVFAMRLERWRAGRGTVGPEWRFRIAPPGEARRPFVPDVAFVSEAALRGLTPAERAAPPIAPTVAVEVLSPGDIAADVRHKIAVYLGAGTELFIIADPRERSLELHDRDGVRRLSGDDLVTHVALPGFTARCAEIYAEGLD